MTDAVVDTSALIEALVGRSPDTSLRWWVVHRQLVAPELIDLEAAHVLRGLTLKGALPAGDARAVLGDIESAGFTRMSHRPLLSRIWQLRQNATAYDAAYIALAELLNVPLLTCDAKLNGVSGHRASVVWFPRSLPSGVAEFHSPASHGRHSQRRRAPFGLGHRHSRDETSRLEYFP